MKFQAKGFGGLQLLLVIVAIAVISLLAVPRYRAYADKAKITEALNLAAQSKRKISQGFMVSGGFPKNSREASAMLSTTVSKPEFVRDMQIDTDGKGRKVTIKVFLNDNVIDNPIGGDQFIFYEGQLNSGGQYAIEWSCGATNISNEYLPEDCRG